MRQVAGIDLGSGFTKAVVLREVGADGVPPARRADALAQRAIVGRGRVKTGVELERAAHSALDQALGQAGLSTGDVAYVATTGFGRSCISFRDIQVTDITAGARGARFLNPEAGAVLDIGNQTTRAISIAENGKVRQFKSNDKCAAGSGSFIVRAAKYLEVRLEDAGELALRARNPQPISSICAVLAESEIINHVSAGVSVEDILCGIYDSLAERASLLLRRVGLTGQVVLIGGVARQPGMVRSLENRLKTKVWVPEDFDYAAALGAALLGAQRLRTRSAEAVHV